MNKSSSITQVHYLRLASPFMHIYSNPTKEELCFTLFYNILTKQKRLLESFIADCN
uniref:Uncharacterized protein n=1 Tax=Arundo donax TaxID=35708 RepID=A0A0A9FPM2_ARUDO